TEELASKYRVHCAPLWRWAKAEGKISEAQVASPKKRSFKMVYGYKKECTPNDKNYEIGVKSQCLLLVTVRLEPEYRSGRSVDAAVASIRRFCLRNRLLGPDKYETVFNIDQTSIYIDLGPKRTIEFVGAKNVDAIQGMSENSFRASLLLCASATNKNVWPRSGPVHQELMGNRNYRKGAILTVQKKAYCDGERMLGWINEVWKPSVTAPRLLLLDSPKTHRMSSVRNTLENESCTSVECIPPEITGLAQPMDGSVMNELKNLCRNYFVSYHAVSDFAEDAPARCKLETEIVARAWREVRIKVIVRGFIKADIAICRWKVCR
ncbi:DDE superfamily endonuclease, partial [Phytophthora infestans]